MTINDPADEELPGGRLIDYVADAVSVRDDRGNLVLWNEAAEKLYGWSAADAVGNDVDILLNSRPAFDPGMLDDGGTARVDVSRLAAGRRMVVVDVQFTGRYRPDGSLRHVVETARDVTEERAARRGLQAEEKRYRNLFHSMTAACFDVDISASLDRLAEVSARAPGDVRAFLLDRPGLVDELIDLCPVMEVNEQVEQIFGVGTSERLRTLAPIWPRESHAVFVDMLLARARGVPRVTCEIRLRSGSGGFLSGVLTACLARNEVGGGRVLIGIVDTTELTRANAAAERSREHHQAVFHHMPIALCHINSEALTAVYADLGIRPGMDIQALLMTKPTILERIGQICFIEEANPQAATLLGAASPDDLVDRPIGFAWRKRPDTLAAIMAAGLKQVPFEGETQLTTLDGRIVDVLFSSAAIQENGRRRSVVGMIDIRERLAAQDAFGRLQAEFAHASRISLLGELSASIAHEISQPLAAIAATGSTGLRWLDHEQPRVAQARTALDRIVGYANRATGIIARMRRMASGRPSALATESINEVVAGALQLIEAQSRSKRIELLFRPAEGNALVRIDRTQIEQVVVNLVVNAIQAVDDARSERREVRVSIDAIEGGIVCAVADSGPGIPEDTLNQVFERFVTSKAEGTGLGLALCRSILDAHHGSIVAEAASDLGGALFSFKLPLDATSEG